MRILLALALVVGTVVAASGARSFTATTHVVSAGADTAIDLHTQFSVCAWIFPTSLTQKGRVIHHGDLSTTPFIEWDLSVTAAGKATIETQTGSPIGATTLTASVWQDICGTWNGTTATVYLNGTSDGSLAASGTLTHTTNLTEIGNSTVFTGNNFAGRIAEVGVWNVSDATIPTRFHNAVAPSRIRPDTLKGYWPLDGRSPENDWFSTFSGTVTGAAVAAHPRIIR